MQTLKWSVKALWGVVIVAGLLAVVVVAALAITGSPLLFRHGVPAGAQPAVDTDIESHQR